MQDVKYIDNYGIIKHGLRPSQIFILDEAKRKARDQESRSNTINSSSLTLLIDYNRKHGN